MSAASTARYSHMSPIASKSPQTPPTLTPTSPEPKPKPTNDHQSQKKKEAFSSPSSTLKGPNSGPSPGPEKHSSRQMFDDGLSSSPAFFHPVVAPSERLVQLKQRYDPCSGKRDSGGGGVTRKRAQSANLDYVSKTYEPGRDRETFLPQLGIHNNNNNRFCSERFTQGTIQNNKNKRESNSRCDIDAAYSLNRRRAFSNGERMIHPLIGTTLVINHPTRSPPTPNIRNSSNHQNQNQPHHRPQHSFDESCDSAVSGCNSYDTISSIEGEGIMRRLPSQHYSLPHDFSFEPMDDASNPTTTTDPYAANPLAIPPPAAMSENKTSSSCQPATFPLQRRRYVSAAATAATAESNAKKSAICPNQPFLSSVPPLYSHYTTTTTASSTSTPNSTSFHQRSAITRRITRMIGFLSLCIIILSSNNRYDPTSIDDSGGLFQGRRDYFYSSPAADDIASFAYDRPVKDFGEWGLTFKDESAEAMPDARTTKNSDNSVEKGVNDVVGNDHDSSSVPVASRGGGKVRKRQPKLSQANNLKTQSMSSNPNVVIPQPKRKSKPAEFVLTDDDIKKRNAHETTRGGGFANRRATSDTPLLTTSTLSPNVDFLGFESILVVLAWISLILIVLEALHRDFRRRCRLCSNCGGDFPIQFSTPPSHGHHVGHRCD